MVAEQRPVESLSFEEALAELESIVRALETGKGDLSRAVADYERGAALKRHCEHQLAEAEARVQAIAMGPQGPVLRDAG